MTKLGFINLTIGVTIALDKAKKKTSSARPSIPYMFPFMTKLAARGISTILMRVATTVLNPILFC